MPNMKIVKFANSVGPVDVAHIEPSHVYLQFFPLVFFIVSLICFFKLLQVKILSPAFWRF